MVLTATISGTGVSSAIQNATYTLTMDANGDWTVAAGTLKDKYLPKM